MGSRIFVFDLDATVTRVEILPALARQVGLEEQMQELTERTMRGELPFQNSFLNRVEMLKAVPVSRVAELVEGVPLNEAIAAFIRENPERCYIATGNLDVWIHRLIARLGLPMSHCFCSTAELEGDRLKQVSSVLEKGSMMVQFVRPVVAIGDGSNDAEMVRLAQVGIGFGGVRPVAEQLARNADRLFEDEEELCRFLRSLLAE